MVDIAIEDHGSVVLLRPLTGTARDWIEEHVNRDGFHPDRPTLVVERRYVSDIVSGAQADGLEVRG
jgi:hypothetical protein